MAAAYRYADEGGEMPRELELYNLVQAYGAQAVFGRPLGYGEIRRMNTAANIVLYYHKRAASGDWGKWAQDNPGEAAALNRAMIAAQAVNDG